MLTRVNVILYSNVHNTLSILLSNMIYEDMTTLHTYISGLATYRVKCETYLGITFQVFETLCQCILTSSSLKQPLIEMLPFHHKTAQEVMIDLS